MSASLGEKLRHVREERKISISEVAEQTRISPLYIEAIEKDDYKTLPGGIFNKGFVKSYAKFIGFDEQEALQDYSQIVAAEELKEADNSQLTYRPEVLTDDRTVNSVPTLILAVLILALLAVGGYYLVEYIKEKQGETVTVANTTANTASQTASTPLSTPAPELPTAPTMANAKFEFSAFDPTPGDSDNGEISLSSTVDGGKTQSAMVAAGTPVVFEAKESLRLTYHKSRAQFAQLKINGTQVELPSEPLNPKKSTIEIDITAANLAQVWQSGKYSGETVAAPTASTPNAVAPTASAPPATSPTVAEPTASPTEVPVATPTAPVMRPNRPPVMRTSPKPESNVAPTVNRPVVSRPTPSSEANKP